MVITAGLERESERVKVSAGNDVSAMSTNEIDNVQLRAETLTCAVLNMSDG